MGFKGWALLIVVSAVAAPVRALELMQAYDLAVRTDPVFQAALMAHAADQEYAAIGRGGLLPTLSWSLQAGRNSADITQGNDTTHRDYRSQATVLSLQQPLFDLQALAAYRQGVARVLAADERLRGQRQALVSKVAQTYSAAVLSRQRLATAILLERGHEQRLAASQRLLTQGAGTRFDEWDIRARLQQVQEQRIEQADALDEALQRLQALVGEPVEAEDLALLDQRTPGQRVPEAYEAWRDLALAHNAPVSAARHALTVAAQEVTRQRAGHWPTVNVYANSRQSLSDAQTSIGQRFDTRSIGLQLNVPLFAGGSVMASTRRASAQLSQARHELDVSGAQTLDELRRHFNLDQRGAERLALRTRAREQAQERLGAMRDARRNGERSDLEVLESEEQVAQARLRQLEALHTWWQARLALRYQAGLLEATELAAMD